MTGADGAVGAPHPLTAMVRRRPPEGCNVVPGSTAVVAFGDPTVAEVATLGINPSVREFAAGSVLLAASQRRLATLDSLGASDNETLTDEQVATVVADCDVYFDRNPYCPWFKPLDELLGIATATTYRDRSACHLDLVQWATDPVWGRIADPAARKLLLDDGVPHLRRQLETSNVRLVLCNGRQVITQVSKEGLAAFEPVGHLVETSAKRIEHVWKLFAGTGVGGVTFLGWSRNLQSPSLATKEFRAELAAWVKQRFDPPPPPGPPIAAAGALSKGTVVHTKNDLVETLRQWLVDSDAARIGDTARYGGTGWLHLQLPGHNAVINADTKRQAVAELCADPGIAGRAWPVIANRAGQHDKVTFRSDGSATPGWYCYLAHPTAPGTML